MLQNEPRSSRITTANGGQNSGWRGDLSRADDQVIAGRLIEEYSEHCSSFNSARSSERILVHIETLRRHFGSLDAVRGNRVLDVACGSRAYKENDGGRYHPWMPRLLVALGATPVGIDLEMQESERFESYSVNILAPDALKFLQSHSFDAYNITAFPTMKALAFMTEFGIEWEPVKQNLLAHLSRILKPGGRPICTLDEQADLFVCAHKRPFIPPAIRRSLELDDF